jgi:hypothetical protein
VRLISQGSSMIIRINDVGVISDDEALNSTLCNNRGRSEFVESRIMMELEFHVWAAARHVLSRCRVGRTIRVSAVQRYPKALPRPLHLLLAT